MGTRSHCCHSGRVGGSSEVDMDVYSATFSQSPHPFVDPLLELCLLHFFLAMKTQNVLCREKGWVWSWQLVHLLRFSSPKTFYQWLVFF